MNSMLQMLCHTARWIHIYISWQYGCVLDMKSEECQTVSHINIIYSASLRVKNTDAWFMVSTILQQWALFEHQSELKMLEICILFLSRASPPNVFATLINDMQLEIRKLLLIRQKCAHFFATLIMKSDRE